MDRLSPEALPKERRLAKRREFVHVYDTGRKFFSRHTVIFIASNDLGHSRIGITATKKSGKANVRNRLKRWTREIYRRHREELAIDDLAVDIVVNVKPGSADVPFEEFSRDLLRGLGRVRSEAGKART